MTAMLRDVFADTLYRVALVAQRDQFHVRANEWSLRISGRIVTTTAVLLETANALANPAVRMGCVGLIDHLHGRDDIEVVPLSAELWQKAWRLYAGRQDKSWSMTDCISFVVMDGQSLRDALTADHHFRQAGFHALLADDPSQGGPRS